MSRSIAAESEQLIDLVRRVALSYEGQYYSLRKVRYPERQAEGATIRRGDLPVIRLHGGC